MKEERESDTETTLAKLRNQMGPSFTLPDLVLRVDAAVDSEVQRSQMYSLMVECAHRAKKNQAGIKELLNELE